MFASTVNSCLQICELMAFAFHVGLPGRRTKKSSSYSQLLFTFRNGSEVFSLFSVKLNVLTSLLILYHEIYFTVKEQKGVQSLTESLLTSDNPEKMIKWFLVPA